jgi:predicted alpha/beta hydrolase
LQAFAKYERFSRFLFPGWSGKQGSSEERLQFGLFAMGSHVVTFLSKTFDQNEDATDAIEEN